MAKLYCAIIIIFMYLFNLITLANAVAYEIKTKDSF